MNTRLLTLASAFACAAAQNSPIAVTVDTTNILNDHVNKKFMGCHHDYGFAQAPRGFYANLVYGATFESGTCAVPSWTSRLTPGAVGSAGPLTDYTPFASKPSMPVVMDTSSPAGSQVGVVNRGLCGVGFSLQANQPYTVDIWTWTGGTTTMFVELIDRTTNTSLARQDFTAQSAGPDWGSLWFKTTLTLTPSAGTSCEGIPWSSDPTIDCGGNPGGNAYSCLRCGGELFVGLSAPGNAKIGYVSLMPGPWGLLKDAGGNPLPVLLSGAQLLQQMGVTVIRSGGSVSQSMRWQDWRGPVWNRASNGQQWGFSALAGWGPFEVADMCAALGIEPIITLAYDLQDPDSWAALVEYAHGDPATTTWGARRAADGHPAPYNITVFELGNEQYNPNFVDQVLAMEARAAAVGAPPLRYMFPSNSGLNSSDAARLLAAAPGVVSRILPDLHVGAGGAVEAAAGLFANPPVPGFNQGAINAETNAGTHDLTRALNEAADLIDWMTYNTTVTDRLYARTASFCTGTGTAFDSWSQGISFFLPNMTWFQPPGYVHIMFTQTWADISVGYTYSSVAPITYALQSPGGFLAAGGDLFVGPLTVAQAEAMCTNLTACMGFTFASNETNPAAPVNMYLKSQVEFSQASGWQTYISSRASNTIPLATQLTADRASFIVRAVNPSNTSQPLSIALQGAAQLTGNSGTQWVLSGTDPAGDNGPANPTAIAPIQSTVPVSNAQLISTVLPAYSVTVMKYGITGA